MKKGTKVAVIAALTCIAAGCVFIGAGAAAGGTEQLKAGEFDYIHLDRDEADFDDVIDLFPLKNVNIGGRYDGEKEEKDIEILTGDFDRDIDYSGTLKKLETKVGVHILEIEEGGDTIHISGKNCDRIQCYVKNGTLYIRGVGKNKKYIRVNDRELTLTVPADICWEDVEMSAAIGGVEADVLDARKIKLDVDMGNIAINRLTADRLEIEADMGNVELTDAQAGGLDAEVNMGNIDFEGVVDGDIEAKASMGSITLTLAQEEDEFNYEISAGMGSVLLDGVDYSGLSHEKKLDNGADWRMQLDSSMGSIDIYFE